MTKKVVGLYELITGVFGVIFLIYSVFIKNKVALSEGILLQVVLGVALFGFLAYAGYGLLNGLKNAEKFSMAIQAFQIPLLFLPSYIYKFSAASFLIVGIKNGHFNWVASSQPINYTIAMNYSDDIVVMVYIVPIIILLALIKSK